MRGPEVGAVVRAGGRGGARCEARLGEGRARSEGSGHGRNCVV